MQLIDIQCRNCGRSIKVNPELKSITCNYCGYNVILGEGIVIDDVAVNRKNISPLVVIAVICLIISIGVAAVAIGVFVGKTKSISDLKADNSSVEEIDVEKAENNTSLDEKKTEKNSTSSSERENGERDAKANTNGDLNEKELGVGNEDELINPGGEPWIEYQEKDDFGDIREDSPLCIAAVFNCTYDTQFSSGDKAYCRAYMTFGDPTVWIFSPIDNYGNALSVYTMGMSDISQIKIKTSNGEMTSDIAMYSDGAGYILNDFSVIQEITRTLYSGETVKCVIIAEPERDSNRFFKLKFSLDSGNYPKMVEYELKVLEQSL